MVKLLHTKDTCHNCKSMCVYVCMCVCVCVCETLIKDFLPKCRFTPTLQNPPKIQGPSLVGQDQIFLHFWVHFPSPPPLQIKGVSADLLIARYFKRCTPLTIYQIQCILQHLLHSTYIFIWKLEKLVKCTLNAVVRLTYNRYINVRVLENVIFTRIDKAGEQAIFS